MDVKALKEVTSGLSLLYVEDDDDLREETSRLFGHLFDKIETASNGKLALDKIREEDFDLLITDINMPVMDGITLTRHVREKSNKQTIIITSAHDESHYLLELIELGIDKFILKPLDMNKLITTLTQACSNIMNEKLIHRYKEEIELSNIQLKASNQELETLVNILDTKIEQLNNINRSKHKTVSGDKQNFMENIRDRAALVLKDPNNINSEGLYLYQDYLSSRDLKELITLEGDLSTLTTLISLQKSIDAPSIIQLSHKLTDYADILRTYPVFNTLTDEIYKLAHSLEEETSAVITYSSDILILLKSFLYILKKWRVSLFETGVKDPKMYDISMINDIQTMKIILKKNESLQRNHDFF